MGEIGLWDDYSYFVIGNGNTMEFVSPEEYWETEDQTKNHTMEESTL